jgi:hypothetical protein
MKDRRSEATVSALAKQAGAEARMPWPQRFVRGLLRKWASRKRHASGLIMFAGQDRPRDLDDPMSDPKVQARIGETIARQVRPKRRSRSQ